MSDSIRINPDVVFQTMEDELVLLNMKTERYFGLDEVGADFWQIANRTTCLDQIVEELHTLYSVEKEQLATDINALVKKLVANNLIEIVPEHTD